MEISQISINILPCEIFWLMVETTTSLIRYP